MSVLSAKLKNLQDMLSVMVCETNGVGGVRFYYSFPNKHYIIITEEKRTKIEIPDGGMCQMDYYTIKCINPEKNHSNLTHHHLHLPSQLNEYETFLDFCFLDLEREIADNIIQIPQSNIRMYLNTLYKEFEGKLEFISTIKDNLEFHIGTLPIFQDNTKVFNRFMEDEVKVRAIRKFIDYNLKEKYSEYFQSSNKEVQKEKTIEMYFENLELKKEFLEALKKEFITERGVSIKILIDVLIEMDLLRIEDRGFNKFLGILEKYLNRSLGQYQSIQNFKLSHEPAHKAVKTSTKERINKILSNLKV